MKLSRCEINLLAIKTIQVLKKLSFYDDVVVDTVKGIPGGVTAAAGGVAGAVGWEGGEEFLKRKKQGLYGGCGLLR